MIEYIKTFFNFKQPEKLLKNKYSSTNFHEKLVLLCLDNAEDVIQNDNYEFLNFLSELYDECDNLKVLVTTYRVLNELPNKHRPTIFIV